MKSENIKSEIEKVSDKIIRIVHKMGSVKFSDATGLNEKDVVAWKNGKRKWSSDKLLKVAKILGL